MSGRNEFYVGYQKQAPAGLARFLRRVVLSIALLGVALAAGLAALQSRFDPGLFEWGTLKSFEGTVRELPYPVLLLDETTEISGEPATELLLVAVGKHGAGHLVGGLDGRRARLEGTLIQRQGDFMLEVVRDGVERLADESGAGPLDERFGERTLRGEIVDSKCFLGVMKPGRGKPHRACAARCISGGVPPVLRVETAEGSHRHYLLVDRAGAPVNERVLDFVAEPVEVTGSVVQRDNLWFLEADPTAFVRLGE